MDISIYKRTNCLLTLSYVSGVQINRTFSLYVIARNFIVFFCRISSSVTPKSPPAPVDGSVSRPSELQSNGVRVGGVKTYQRKLARRRRTNLLLMMVSLVFFIAWAPIHIYLIILDIFKPFQVSYVQKQLNSIVNSNYDI